jgi:hypothetical protein
VHDLQTTVTGRDETTPRYEAALAAL